MTEFLLIRMDGKRKRHQQQHTKNTCVFNMANWTFGGQSLVRSFVPSWHLNHLNPPLSPWISLALQRFRWGNRPWHSLSNNWQGITNWKADCFCGMCNPNLAEVRNAEGMKHLLPWHSDKTTSLLFFEKTKSLHHKCVSSGL